MNAFILYVEFRYLLKILRFRSGNDRLPLEQLSSEFECLQSVGEEQNQNVDARRIYPLESSC